MIAEDHAESKEAAKKIYDCIRNKLLSSSGDHKLPIMYVIDSILKNAKGCYITLFEEDAPTWMQSVYLALPDETRRFKLKKVWNTWKDFGLFREDIWKAMGECFDVDSNAGSMSPSRPSSPLSSSLAAGIPRSVRFRVDGHLPHALLQNHPRSPFFVQRKQGLLFCQHHSDEKCNVSLMNSRMILTTS